MTRVAAYDLGSNSFHLLVADVAGDGTITRVLRRKVMLGLGTTVATSGRMGDRIGEVVATLKELAALVADAGAERSVACGTAAFRDAADQHEVLRAIEDATGLRVIVISGEQEAELVFHAVRASLPLQPAPALCLDLGGGSLELTIGDTEQLRWSASVPLGVARLTADAIRKDPPGTKDLRRLAQAVDDSLGPLWHDLQRHEPQMLVGSSGTLKNLAAAALRRRGDPFPESLHGVTVSLGELVALHHDLETMTSEEREALPGLEPRRAPLVVAGSTVLMSVMDAMGLDELTISEWALREGMLLAGARLVAVEA